MNIQDVIAERKTGRLVTKMAISVLIIGIQEENGTWQKDLLSKNCEIKYCTQGTDAIRLFCAHPYALIICLKEPCDIPAKELFHKAKTVCPASFRIMLVDEQEKGKQDPSLYITISFRDNEALLLIFSSLIEQYKLIHENQALTQLILNQHKSLGKIHEILRHDLQAGSKIYETVLRGKSPTDIPECKIATHVQTSKELTGNFFEFYQPTNEILDIVLGNVTSKGMPATLIATTVKMNLVRFSMPFFHNLHYNVNHNWKDDLLNVEDVITQLNKSIIKQLVSLDLQVNLNYGRFDFTKRCFQFVDCGNEAILHFVASEKKVYYLRNNNAPLGSSLESKFQSANCHFSKDDIFIFISDDIKEVRSIAPTPYDLNRLEEILKEHTTQDIQTLLNFMIEDIKAFTGYNEDQMPLTIIAVKLEEIPTASYMNMPKAQFISHISQIPAFRDFIQFHCMNSPGNHEKLYDQMQLALIEAFTNIIIHGYENDPTGKIIVEVDWDDQGITFVLSDQGVGFNPAEIPHPSLTGERESGFGWYIIKSVADEIVYQQRQTESGWNHLRIYKRYILNEEEMEITYKQEGTILVITPHFDSLDARESREFKQKIVDKITQEEHEKVVLDLSNIQYVDSSGLGSLLSILKALHSKRGDLKLSNLKKPVRTIFELVAMHKIFEIYNSADEAVNSYR